MAAIRLATGERLWLTKPPLVPERRSLARIRRAAQLAPGWRTGSWWRGSWWLWRLLARAAPRRRPLIPGVVFSGTMDGIMRAYDTQDGRIIWEFNTRRPFPTINGVEGKGGGSTDPGP